MTEKMKIVFITPGSGDTFYCGNCLRDNLYAQSLRRAGHDVVILPLYLPIEGANVEKKPVFFSAAAHYISCMAGQRPLPTWLKKMLSAKPVVSLASSMSGTTSPVGLEKMTLSMIYGNDKAFLSEAAALVGWIEQHGKPDVVHIATSMLTGIARVIKERMNVPIVCSLKDEEVWLDKMRAQFIDLAWRGIAGNIPFVDKFVTISDFYRQYIQARIPELAEVEVIYPGLVAPQKLTAPPAQPAIGYLSRLNRDNGADVLCKAFVMLKQRNTIPNLKLKMCGGYTHKDSRFVREIKRILKPCRRDAELVQRYDVAQPENFMESVSVLSVPLQFDEGIGLYVCQAYAAGRPTVMPATGSFPEIVGNGGLLYQPNEPQRLADALEKILTDQALYEKCRENALAIAAQRFGDKKSAQALERLYRF